MYPQELRYHEEHTWVKPEGAGLGRVGLTYYAQDLLKELVYLELPQKGTEIMAGEACGTIESRKATFDLFSPVNGVVSEVNGEVETQPAVVNRDPYGKGWLFVVRLLGPAETAHLMSADQYRDLILSK